MAESSCWKVSLWQPRRGSGPLVVWYILVTSAVLGGIIATLLLQKQPFLSLRAIDEVDTPRLVSMDFPFRNLRQVQIPKAQDKASSSITLLGSGIDTPNSKSKMLVQPGDFVYQRRPKQWDAAPIVIEEYKLLFFTVPKVACTTFKQLFRRIAGMPDWKSQDPKRMLPHNPVENGLKYLYNYTLEEANEFMTSPEWTRAIFVRDPKMRFLSAFLDKSLGNFGNHVRVKCCRKTRACVKPAQTSKGFLEVIQNCSDPHWNPQTDRMESKFWEYVNFVGHFERLSEDGPKLLRRIGAWEKYGKSGWGKYGNSSLFQTSAVDQNHVTGSMNKTREWYTPGLERQVEKYYEDDYSNPWLGYKRGHNLTRDLWIHPHDKIWASTQLFDAGAPVVVDKYKLIFFTVPRVGDQIWKQALRRMEGLPDWKEISGPKDLVHDPELNGLTYLHDLDPDYAEQIIKDETWTKAVFVRNPKDRLLEAFAFMSKNDREVRRHCCPVRRNCAYRAHEIKSFVKLTLSCKSDQWELQSRRMESKYWEYINFIGRIESVEDDAKQLMDKIGAWDDIGASGWGPDGEDRIFGKVDGQNNDIINHELDSYYTLEVDKWLEEIYKEDLENERFSFRNASSSSLSYVKPDRH